MSDKRRPPHPASSLNRHGRGGRRRRCRWYISRAFTDLFRWGNAGFWAGPRDFRLCLSVPFVRPLLITGTASDILVSDFAIHLISPSSFSGGICRVSERLFAKITGEAVQGTDIVATSCFDICISFGFTVAFVNGGAERGNGYVSVVHESGDPWSVV